MDDTKFTPGPWAYDPDDAVNHNIYSAEGFHICNPTGGFNSAGMAAANAYLIAAAPDLYAALELVAKRCGPLSVDGKIAQAALAKARGDAARKEAALAEIAQLGQEWDAKPLTEYECKLAQLKKDFPNGI